MTYQTIDASLKRYMEDIRKTAPISREEEQALFRLARRGDAQARERLVKANMRFVLKVALQYRGCPIPLPDLVSEGSMGLIRAVESFDTSRGIKFISYAVWWMKAYITKAINETGSMIRLPANQCLRVRKALKEHAQGKELDDDVRGLMQTSGRGLSFDAPLSGDSKTTFQEVLRDDRAASAEDELDKNATGELVRELISELPEREAQVITGLFGMDQNAPLTLREVGMDLNISHERVRQLRDQALRRIRSSGSFHKLENKYQGYFQTLEA
ncbi:MAG TPA: RNA polymerase sigma factor RpoD/SigA [Fibrobacteria bacterium]|nr:RNA polymerase sigma factor RpoD/SigA [Fibrobacteria bacterium]